MKNKDSEYQPCEHGIKDASECKICNPNPPKTNPPKSLLKWRQRIFFDAVQAEHKTPPTIGKRHLENK